MADDAVIDVTGDGATPDGRKRSRDVSPERRRTHRKTESRVFFGDVQAQEREMERINYEKRGNHPSAASTAPATAPGTRLRKGETAESPAQRSKKKRAMERRSQRQKLRRTMSPRSPDGGPQRPLRGGVSLAQLDGDGDAPKHPKRRFTRDEDAIQDALLHSTAWRNLKFEAAPDNVLPDRDGMLKPYALSLDAPLEVFDELLKEKCPVTSDFLKSKPLMVATVSWGELKDEKLMDDRVRELIDEATPLVKKSHAARANAILANTRQQIAAYIEDRPIFRAKAAATTGELVVPLQISKLEKVAARRLLRDSEFLPDGDQPPRYQVGRTESGHSEQVYPRSVTYLSKIVPIPRSTTCMLARGTHRVEDDPIIRFVPYFSAAKNGKPKDPHVSTTERCKDTLVGMDDEVNEYVLRYIVHASGGDQAVFEALQRIGAFSQPIANYSDILERVTRNQLCKRHLHDLEVLEGSDEISSRRKREIGTLLEECNAIRAGVHLRGRLQPFPAHVVLNHLQQSRTLGVREAPSGQYREVAVKYQDFFCRRCCSYSCRNHGREQPVPAVRVDPRYPVVKASSKLWRRVEKKRLLDELARDSADSNDTEVQTDAVPTPDSDEPMSELTPASDRSGNEEKQRLDQSEHSTGEDSNGGERTRRSPRAQTAASTKASSKLNMIRAQVKKLARSKATYVSEYLGFDSVYQDLTQDRKLALLSEDARCGPLCSKRVADSEHADQTTDLHTSLTEHPFEDSEVVLLTKLEKCVGPNPCVLAEMLSTRSCAEVAEFLRRRESQPQGRRHELGLMRSGVFGRNRERNNGVLGNSYEHLRRTRLQRMRDRGANHEYVPCNHDGGSCDSAQCSCMRRDHYCEKSCGCSLDCSNRFPGCHCEIGQCGTNECPCYFAARECDPDVCTSCGASELPVVMADEESQNKTIAQLKICQNVNIMRSRKRKIGVSASETHGWGAYALENVKKGEFMYEYTGSLLSQDEAERRGNVYDKTTISFLFDLNEDSVVDATRKGNKSKFANHDSKNPKCFARIMLVNGDHRIGIYAMQDISAGDELFFDYGYSGVIPDWSQARIGSSKETPSTEEDEGSKEKETPADVKEEVES
jgi:hypothetical protein